MYKQKIGISIGNNYSLPISEVVALLKKIGFDAISPVWETEPLVSVGIRATKCAITILKTC